MGSSCSSSRKFASNTQDRFVDVVSRPQRLRNSVDNVHDGCPPPVQPAALPPTAATAARLRCNVECLQSSSRPHLSQASSVPRPGNFLNQPRASTLPTSNREEQRSSLRTDATAVEGQSDTVGSGTGGPLRAFHRQRAAAGSGGSFEDTENRSVFSATTTLSMGFDPPMPHTSRRSSGAINHNVDRSPLSNRGNSPRMLTFGVWDEGEPPPGSRLLASIATGADASVSLEAVMSLGGASAFSQQRGATHHHPSIVHVQPLYNTLRQPLRSPSCGSHPSAQRAVIAVLGDHAESLRSEPLGALVHEGVDSSGWSATAVPLESLHLSTENSDPNRRDVMHLPRFSGC